MERVPLKHRYAYTRLNDVTSQNRRIFSAWVIFIRHAVTSNEAITSSVSFTVTVNHLVASLSTAYKSSNLLTVPLFSQTNLQYVQFQTKLHIILIQSIVNLQTKRLKTEGHCVPNLWTLQDLINTESIFFSSQIYGLWKI